MRARSDIQAQYPYLLHTNRELGLMLAGIKPAAFFGDVVDALAPVLVRYLSRFDRHVSAGRLVRRDCCLDPRPRLPWRMHRIYFALPAEEWRIDELIALHDAMFIDRIWSVETERREGELLGYEDWMNDFHLARLARLAEKRDTGTLDQTVAG
ncbi:hypothetical protein [Aureimonas sp. D3]|uniref:hypothetical protein n=1 Tax=Aureimonas sp. D3 TaxID=1638164 RepID=UPI0007857073|nr:hypothetical protein [Aureimonas sp. D3]